MQEAQNCLVTALLPHYNTPELVKLCLRSLKRYSDLSQLKVIVIDNGSTDDSLDYLKSLDWITLLKRQPAANETPSQAHVRAMELGMQQVTTPYILSLHTDTIVNHPGWLDFLLQYIKQDDNIAGVGSWKLEYKPPIKRFFKAIERFWQLKIWFPLTGKGKGNIAGAGKNHYFLRSHCALYKTDLVKKYTDGFGDSGECAGKGMHRKLEAAGFKLIFIPSEELSRYMKHLNHATMILNPAIAGKKTGKPKAHRQLQRELKAINYKQILDDPSLDKGDKL